MRIGEKFKSGRYVVVQKLGWGHFSTVWLVADTDTGDKAAMKVRAGGQAASRRLTSRGQEAREGGWDRLAGQVAKARIAVARVAVPSLE